MTDQPPPTNDEPVEATIKPADVSPRSPRSAPKWEAEAKDRLRTAVRRYAKPLADLVARDANEGDTRLLVTDFLCEGLGYDKYANLTTEYQVKGEFADYGVRIDKELVAFIEVKRCTTKLGEKHLRQVQMYAVWRRLQSLSSPSQWLSKPRVSSVRPMLRRAAIVALVLVAACSSGGGKAAPSSSSSPTTTTTSTTAPTTTVDPKAADLALAKAMWRANNQAWKTSNDAGEQVGSENAWPPGQWTGDMWACNVVGRHFLEVIVDDTTFEPDPTFAPPNGPAAGQVPPGRIYVMHITLTQDNQSSEGEAHVVIAPDGKAYWFPIPCP